MLVFEPQSAYRAARNTVSWIHATAEDEETLLARADTLGIYCVDVSRSLAEALTSITRGKFFHFEVKEELDHLLSSSRSLALANGANTLGLFNLGILFEPQLQLDAAQIIKDQTRHGAIVLFWPGLSVGSDTLQLSPEDRRTHVQFHGVTLQQVILPHEV